MECWWLGSLIFLGLGRGVSRAEKLPAPRSVGPYSVEEILARRRSIRELASAPLSRNEIGQLLWSLQGVTDREGLRTTPSAGALYPLEVYVATADGVYHYRPRTHDVVQTVARDVRAELRKAAVDQECMDAPAVFAIAAVFERVTRKYTDRGDLYVHLEVGHAAQNLLLQVTALDLAAVPVGAFDEARVRMLLELRSREVPLYLIPVGRRT